MLKNKTLLSCFLMFSSFSCIGVELNVDQEIPERYVLFTGISEDGKLDKKEIEKDFKQKCKEADVPQCQFAIYAKGDKKGDGILAFGEQRKDKNVEVTPYDSVPYDKKNTLGKIYETIGIGYQIKTKDLYQAYEDNEVVADEDFKGKKILLKFKIKDVAKDAFDNPYITTAVDQHGFKTIQIHLNKKDPFLRKIKKGATVTARATAEKFVIKQVIMKGEIIASEKPNLILYNGKAFGEQDFKNLSEKKK